MKFIPLIILAVLFGACAGDATVETDFNPTADFTRYASFTIAAPSVKAREGSVAHDPRVLETIREAIREDLSARPMTPLETGADLSIAISIVVGEETAVDQWGYQWDSAGDKTELNTYPFKEGTLVIDFFDAESNQLVWRSWARSAVSRTGDPDLGLLKKMVHSMLQEYPPDPTRD